MKLNEYQDEVMAFRLDTADNNYAMFGLAGEVGELYSLFAKCIRDGADPTEYNRNVKKELGDILWFVAAIAKDMGFTLEEVAYANYTKLASRAARNTLTGSGDER